jgi:hypothetical protein
MHFLLQVSPPEAGEGWSTLVKVAKVNKYRKQYDNWMRERILPVQVPLLFVLSQVFSHSNVPLLYALSQLTFENGMDEDIRIFRDNGPMNFASGKPADANLPMDQSLLYTLKPQMKVRISAHVGQIFQAKDSSVGRTVGLYAASSDLSIVIKPGGPDGTLISKSTACSTESDLGAYDNGTLTCHIYSFFIRLLPVPSSQKWVDVDAEAFTGSEALLVEHQQRQLRNLIQPQLVPQFSETGFKKVHCSLHFSPNTAAVLQCRCAFPKYSWNVWNGTGRETGRGSSRYGRNSARYLNHIGVLRTVPCRSR